MIISSGLLAIVSLLLPASSQPIQDPDRLRTRPESTSYRETSRYDDVREFLKNVSVISQRIRLSNFGYSLEGRALPLAIVSTKPQTPSEVRGERSKVRVLLLGNIHGGEVCGKEALLMLLRSLAEGKHPEWLENLILLVAPLYNADGNERIALDNRRAQNGPYGGMGQRPNAAGLDLNRDHIKLKSPESRSLVGLINTYDPHVVIDLHTTNGTPHGYHLTYSPPLHPATAPSITDFLRSEWLPSVRGGFQQELGWDAYYYGNVPRRPGVQPGWYTFDHRPRFNNNYVGLRNRFAVLSEAFSYATFEERIRATRVFVEQNLHFVHRNADRIRGLVERADTAKLVGKALGLRATLRRGEPVEIRMGKVQRVPHPYLESTILQRTDETRLETMPDFGSFRSTLTRKVPAGYLVPERLGHVVSWLRTHGIVLTTFSPSSPQTVERFQIVSIHRATREFQGHRQVQVEGEYRSGRLETDQIFQLASTNQPLGRLLFLLLEPESDDGAVNWNFFDDELEEGSPYPVYRVSSP